MNAISIGTVLRDGRKEYRVVKYIGSGGFADVYQAVDGENTYAVKVIKTDDPQLVKSVKNEFDIASKVVSEHAIRYYYMNEHGQNDYPCFIIMEYAEGGSLFDELTSRQKSGKRYTTEEFLNVCHQLIDGMVDISHVAVHRDIKPQNILMSNGIYKISDYGLAKYAGAATRATSQTMKNMGSFLYYAPELWNEPDAHGLNGEQIDIYAMGIVFYQLVNLRYPYKRTANYAMMHMTAAIEPFDKDIDVTIQSLICKMMEKPRAKRFSNWLQVKEFLESSSLGNSKTRDVFVEDMLKSDMAKRQLMDTKTEEESKAHIEKEVAFKRLISQIRTEIYEPLKQFVDDYNHDSAQYKMHLSEITANLNDETFAFNFTSDSNTDDEEARSIKFRFEATHPETATTLIKRSKVGLFFAPGLVQQTQKIELKYLGQRILLWGVVKADCGTGVNIAVLENQQDPLYGTVKTFIRTPNVRGQDIWIPHESTNLKKLCVSRFHEVEYTTRVDDFNFSVIQELIKQNQAFPYNGIDDPIKRAKQFL